MAQLPTEKTKPLSWVWSYFKPTDIAGVRYNVCHAPITPGSNELCLKRMIPDKSGGTKSMGNHLERKHRLSKSDPPPLTPITLSLTPSNQALSSSSSSAKRRLNRDALIHAIVRFIVACNLPFQISNNQHFIDLLHLCNPLITPSLISPDLHITLTRSIHHKFKLARRALQSHLDQLTSSSFSLSATLSTPNNRNHSVLAIVLHWVSDPPHLKSVLLAVTQLSKNPSSRNIALAIAKTLNEFRIQNKIFSLTIDNVPDLNQFGYDLNSLIPEFKPQSQLIGCMARLINRAAEIALEDFQHFDHLPKNLTHNSSIQQPSQHFNLRTIISRLQDLTLLLRQSTQRAESFNRIVAAVSNNNNNSPFAGLSINPSNSSWTSTYQVLSHAYQIKEAIQIFCLKESGFSQYHIHDQEWDHIKLVSDFLKPLNVAANVIAIDKACDMITATPTYCWLLRRLNKVSRNYEGREIPESIKQMLDILNEFSEKTNRKPIHTFGMILDPRIKMSNFEDELTSRTHSQSNEMMNNRLMSLEEIKKSFYLCSLPYSQHPIANNSNHNDLHPIDQEPQQPTHMMGTRSQNSNDNINTKKNRSSQHQHPTSYPSDSDSDYKTGQPRIFKKKPKLMIGLEDEISNYLEMECEESNCNPLEYWKINFNRFPSLSKMSKDFLAIQSCTGLAFKSICKFNQLFDSSSSDFFVSHNDNDSDKPDLKSTFTSLKSNQSSSNNQQHHYIDSQFTTSNLHHNTTSLQQQQSSTHFNPSQHNHQNLIVPDHTNDTTMNNNITSNQRLITSSFPILHPPPISTQNQQEFNLHNNAFQVTNSNTHNMSGSNSNNSSRDQDIIVDSNAAITLPSSIQDNRNLLNSSINHHLLINNNNNRDSRLDFIPNTAAIHNHNNTIATTTTTTTTSDNNNHTKISTSTATSNNNKPNTVDDVNDLNLVDDHHHLTLSIDKLDAFTSTNSFFSSLSNIVCLSDWCFNHQFVQI